MFEEHEVAGSVEMLDHLRTQVRDMEEVLRNWEDLCKGGRAHQGFKGDLYRRIKENCIDARFFLDG